MCPNIKCLTLEVQIGLAAVSSQLVSDMARNSICDAMRSTPSPVCRSSYGEPCCGVVVTWSTFMRFRSPRGLAVAVPTVVPAVQEVTITRTCLAIDLFLPSEVRHALRIKGATVGFEV